MPAEPTDILPGLYAAFASIVLFVIVTAVFVGAESFARGSVGVAALGSGAVGYFTVARGLAAPLGGALQFARPWLWFAVWAAVGLYDGRYRPLVLATGLAVGMAVSFLTGGAMAAWRRRS